MDKSIIPAIKNSLSSRKESDISFSLNLLDDNHNLKREVWKYKAAYETAQNALNTASHVINNLNALAESNLKYAQVKNVQLKIYIFIAGISGFITGMLLTYFIL